MGGMVNTDKDDDTHGLYYKEQNDSDEPDQWAEPDGPEDD
jgi:hypothetical protein